MKCLSPISVLDGGHRVPARCGRCLPCLIRKSSGWAFRNVMEFQSSYSASFVTFTYDETSCPSRLEMEHISTFFKNWREHLRYHHGLTGVRFFACGEYGEKYGRPHYHALIYDGPSLPMGLSRIEQWPYGFVFTGQVTLQSINYTARYCTKPTPDGPNRLRSSRNPPIGADGLRLLGRQLFIHGHSLDEKIGYLKLGGRSFAVDKTARKYLLAGYQELGGVPKAPLPALLRSDEHVLDLKLGDPVLADAQRIRADFFTQNLMKKREFYAKL